MELVDFFGNLLWTAAVWSILSGLVTDWLSSRINKPSLEAKVIVTLGTMFFDNFCGLLMHGLQETELYENIKDLKVTFQKIPPTVQTN